MLGLGDGECADMVPSLGENAFPVKTISYEAIPSGMLYGMEFFLFCFVFIRMGNFFFFFFRCWQ